MSERTLEDLRVEANGAHDSVLKSMRDVVRHAKRAGDALIAAKKEVGHKNWTTWLTDNFDASVWTARAYMRIARAWEKKLEPTFEANPLMTLDAALAYLRESPPREELHLPPPGQCFASKQQKLHSYFRSFVQRLREKEVELIVVAELSGNIVELGGPDITETLVQAVRDQLPPALIEAIEPISDEFFKLKNEALDRFLAEEKPLDVQAWHEDHKRRHDELTRKVADAVHIHWQKGRTDPRATVRHGGGEPPFDNEEHLEQNLVVSS